MNLNYLPDEFLVEYGPILHPNEGFTVGLKGQTLIYLPGTYEAKEKMINPIKSKWKNFWDEVEDLGLWDWEQEYHLCCLDGTGWKIKIEYNGKEVDSVGQNHYPANFLNFFDALEELISLELKLDF
ncbi:MAG TPA: hypothetical protein VK444_02790 [Methanobacteriaceae archaeon]|nr:hypothetical protein [Methanobacteriaceae archaeon]